MDEKKALLPVGSVVYLNNGQTMLVIVGLGQVVPADNEQDLPTYWDYLAGLYPQGFDNGYMYYFNQQDIDKVIFKGLENEESNRYLELIKTWKLENQGKYQVKTDLKTQYLNSEEDK